MPPRPGCASDEEISVALERLLAIYGRPEAWDVAAPVYIEALSDLSPALLGKAVARCLRDRLRFMPTPGELRGYLAGDDDDDLPPPRLALPGPDDAEKHRLLDMLGEVVAASRLGFLDRASFERLTLAELRVKGLALVEMAEQRMTGEPLSAGERGSHA